MYFNFQQKVGLVHCRSIKTVHANLLTKIMSCITLPLPGVNKKKSNVSDMHHRITYMYINFQQNRVNRSVISAHTILFCK